MSSVFRKGQTLFQPRKKNVVRRKNVKGAASPSTGTTPSGAGTPGSGAESPNTPVADISEGSLTPAATQVEFYGDKSSSEPQISGANKAQQDEDIDPMDVTKQLSPPSTQMSISTLIGGHDKDDKEPEGEDYEDNDIFARHQQQVPSNRRRSSVSQRRLLGISIRKKSTSRSSSISGIPGSTTIETNDRPIPVVIEDPKLRAKRRRSSAVKRPSKRVSISEPSNDGTSHEVGIVSERDSNVNGRNEEAAIDEEDEVVGDERDDSEGNEQDKDDGDGDGEGQPGGRNDPAIATTLPTSGNIKSSVVLTVPERPRDELYAEGKKVIYALDSSGQKLIQYRTGDLIESDWEKYKLNKRKALKLPLAPEVVKMTVTSIDQIPNNAYFIPPELLYDIDINPENMSMKDLCQLNLPVGKVSDNIGLVNAAKARERASKEFRRRVRQRAKIERISYEEAQQLIEDETFTPNNNNDNNDDKNPKIKVDENGDATQDDQIKKEEGNAKKRGDQQANKSGGLQLQVSDGKLDIDTESTFRQQSNVFDNMNRRVEETNPFERPVISNTYSKRKQTDKWDLEEEHQFFKALSDWGTDFSIISNLFPHRTRRQIKSKFNNEEKRRPGLIESALTRKFSPDLDEYQQIIRKGTIIRTIEDFNKARDQLKTENDQQKKEILKEQERAQKEDAERNRWREIERKSGQRQPLEKLTRHQQLRQNEEIVGTVGR